MHKTQRVQVVAEISANHKGDMSLLMKTIEVFHEAGADAVKIQTYDADSLTIDCNKDDFIISGGSLWDGQSYYDLYRSACTPAEWVPGVYAHCRERNIKVFSTPFSQKDADVLRESDNPVYKIASFELIDTDFVDYVASFQKPMIMSTGIANLGEIYEAVEICRVNGVRDITLLHCISSYPAGPDQMNLRTMQNMRETFGVDVGISDHTIGPEIAVAATALGTSLIEKHVTLDRSSGGPDSTFSMEPHEFATMVEMIRNVEKGLGHIRYDHGASGSLTFARSLYVVQDVKRGEIVSRKNIRSIRPGLGMKPGRLRDVLGKRFNKDVERGERLRIEDIC